MTIFSKFLILFQINPIVEITRKICSLITAIVLTFNPLPAQKCEAKCNGTFLQSWMSAYWDDARWQQEISAMEEAGIEYLIIQDLANLSSSGQWEVYYDSALPAFQNAVYDGGNVVESALRNCKGTKVKVIIGLALFDNWWVFAGIGKEYKDVCNVTAGMIKEIYNNYVLKQPETFYGWYFTPEINNGPTMKLSVSSIADGINTVIDAIEETDADRPLVLSPYYTQYISNPSLVGAKAFWVSFLKQTNLREQDVFVPQDAVGAGWCLEENLINTWQMYASAVKDSGKKFHLWANCENFTTAHPGNILAGTILRPSTENTEDVTAPMNRFIRQMEIASSFAENIITFSYSHYYSPYCVDPMFHNTYLDYLENGKPESEPPTVPTNLRLVGNELQWDASTDNFGIAYYRICLNGAFLCRREYWDETSVSVDGKSGIYTVTAYDPAGNSSPVATIKIG